MILPILSWMLTVGWMAVIFFFSSQSAPTSAQLSTSIADKLFRMALSLLPRRLEEWQIIFLSGEFDHLVRKLAHTSEYFILGIFAVLSLKLSKVSGKRLYWMAWSFCVFYAISDEVHQTFVPGRACRVSDVFIDSMGAILGLYVFYKFQVKKVRKVRNEVPG